MIGIENSDGFPVVVLRGELDSANIATVDQTLGMLQTGGVSVVSLTDVAYLDSSALSVFVRHQNASGGRLVLVVPPGNPVERIFDITGLRDFLCVSPSVTDALRRAQQLRDVAAGSFSRDGVLLDSGSTAEAQR